MAKKVLIVDDNQALRENLSSILGEKGYDVTSIGAGESIWDAVEKDIFDLIILDLIMPEKNTISILGGLKSNSPHTRILIYSGYEEYEKSSYAHIADAFLCKSKGPETLLSLMDKLLAK